MENVYRKIAKPLHTRERYLFQRTRSEGNGKVVLVGFFRNTRRERRRKIQNPVHVGKVQILVCVYPESEKRTRDISPAARKKPDFSARIAAVKSARNESADFAVFLPDKISRKFVIGLARVVKTDNFGAIDERASREFSKNYGIKILSPRYQKIGRRGPRFLVPDLHKFVRYVEIDSEFFRKRGEPRT